MGQCILAARRETGTEIEKKSRKGVKFEIKIDFTPLLIVTFYESNSKSVVMMPKDSSLAFKIFS